MLMIDPARRPGERTYVSGVIETDHELEIAVEIFTTNFTEDNGIDYRYQHVVKGQYVSWLTTKI